MARNLNVLPDRMLGDGRNRNEIQNILVVLPDTVWEMAKIQFRMCTVITQNFSEPCQNIACCWCVLCSNLIFLVFKHLSLGSSFFPSWKKTLQIEYRTSIWIHKMLNVGSMFEQIVAGNTSKFPIGKLSDISFPCSTNFEFKLQYLPLMICF